MYTDFVEGRRPIIKPTKASPFDALSEIEKEISEDLSAIQIGDPLTKEYLQKVVVDYKYSQYAYLQWTDKKYKPQKVLYAGCGFDRIPKIAFGRDRVVHTSLENFKTDDKNYFTEIDSDLKVIADNTRMPFKNETFDAVLIFGLPDKKIKAQKAEIDRVLKKNGFFTTESNIFNDTAPDMYFSNYKKLPVPSRFQKAGDSQTVFSLFKKTA